VRSLALVVLIGATACTKAHEATPATGSAGSAGSAAVAVKPVTPVKDGIAIPANHPTSGIVISNHCSLSPHPPSTFFWSHLTSYDLDAGTWTSERREGHDRPSATPPIPTNPGDPAAPDPDAPKLETANGVLPADRIATIRARLAELLAGGPYPPKYPYSGGSRCTLSLAAKGQPPFFSIDRADREIQDAVTALVVAL